MSKAFTSEETPDEGPLTRPPPRLAPGEARYVTAEGLAELRLAQAALRAEPAAVADGRAARLEATLGLLTVLGASAAPPDEVAFGRFVTVEGPAGRRATWRIVGPDEADARRGRLSVDAPLARALLGRRAGELVEVAQPGGTRELLLVAVDLGPP